MKHSPLSPVAQYISEICLELLETEPESAEQLWTEFCNGLLKSTHGQVTRWTSFKPEIRAMVLMTALRMKDWGLWNDVIASLPQGTHDLPDDFFFDVCEEVLMGEVTFEQIQEG
jgi:hypothetical protein